MDLVYMSENFAFDSFRMSYPERNQRIDYNYRPGCNGSANNVPKRSYQGKQHCKICKEKSQKALSTYIRQKSTSDFTNSISEEAEEQ